MMTTCALKKCIEKTLKVLFTFIGFVVCVAASQPSIANQKSSKVQVINYGQIELGLKKAYQKELLETLLDATVEKYGPYQLNFVTNTENWSTARYLNILKRGDIINLSWGAVNADTPDELGMARIHYPILKNSNGYRILLIREEDQDKFEQIKTLADFQKLTAGQGEGWADADIIEESHIPLLRTPIIQNLYPMLSAKRFDHFPLGMLEVHEELAKVENRYTNLKIDSSILLYYPSPIYFQANIHHPKLIARMNAGMKYITESGQLDEIFYKHFGEEIKKFNLAKRTIIQLNNPFLPNNITDISPKLIDLSPPSYSHNAAH